MIPASEADDVFICVGVFIHWEAADDAKIQDYNYRAVKELIARAIAGKPTAAEATGASATRLSIRSVRRLEAETVHSRIMPLR